MEFTNEEKQRIDQLYGNDFQGIEPSDGPLIERWGAFKATMEEEHITRMQAIEDEANARRKAIEAETERSQAAYELMRAEILARRERRNDGEKE